MKLKHWFKLHWLWGLIFGFITNRFIDCDDCWVPVEDMKKELTE